MRAGIFATAMVAWILGTTGCEGPAPPHAEGLSIAAEPPARTEPPEAVGPWVHLADADFETVATGLRRAAPVSLGDVFQPTFSASRSRPVAYACDQAASGTVRICRAPTGGKAPAGSVLEVRTGKRPRDGERTWIEVPPGGVATFELAQEARKPGRGRFATLHTALPLEQRTVITAPQRIPRDAALRFSYGVEEPAWRAGAAAVRFLIDATAGDATVRIFEAVLDPTADEGNRGWHEAVVPLGAWAEKRVSFTFRTVPAAGPQTGTSLPVWGDPTIFAPRSEPTDRPWVVLISLDTLRARSMSLYGREYETTPYLEEVAAQGTAFARAYTTFPKTHGSHMSAFSSLLPHRHGVFGPANLGVVEEEHEPLLSERLRAAGWRTIAFTENGLLDGRLFSHGYERYEESKFLKSQRGEARETFERTLAWLEPRAHEGPFYVFVHTYEVHGPYDPDEKYADFAADVPLPLQRRYEQETRGLDDLLREFIPRLRTLAGDRGMLLVVFADHGEEFLEHGGVDHLRLFDEVMHVPLLFQWSGHVAEGRMVEHVVSLTDVAPTVLDLLGLSGFARTDGVSLAPLLQPAEAAPTRRTAFGQVPPGGGNHREWQFIARTREGKCFASVDEEGSYCFDLVEDPAEMKKLRPTEATGALAAVWEKAAAYREAARDAVSTRRARSKTAPAPPGVDPARERKLRALGYIDD